VVDYASSNPPTFDDRAWRPSAQSIVVILAAITLIALVGWSETGIRAAQAHEPQRFLNLMPRATQAYYESRYFDTPALIGSIVYAALGALVTIQVLRRRWRARSLGILIALLAGWMLLIFSLIWINDCAMT
jgi:hypothetical protein